MAEQNIMRDLSFLTNIAESNIDYDDSSIKKKTKQIQMNVDRYEWMNEIVKLKMPL